MEKRSLLLAMFFGFLFVASNVDVAYAAAKDARHQGGGGGGSHPNHPAVVHAGHGSGAGSPRNRSVNLGHSGSRSFIASPSNVGKVYAPSGHHHRGDRVDHSRHRGLRSGGTYYPYGYYNDDYYDDGYYYGDDYYDDDYYGYPPDYYAVGPDDDPLYGLSSLLNRLFG